MRSVDGVGSLSRSAPARSSARNGSGGARVAISRTRGAARRRRDGTASFARLGQVRRGVMGPARGHAAQPVFGRRRRRRIGGLRGSKRAAGLRLQDHQYASDAVARKPAARHGPAQGPSSLDVIGRGGQTARSHHDSDLPRIASSKSPPARRRTRFSRSRASVRGGKVALGQRRPSRAVRGPIDVQSFARRRCVQP